ncbi:nuclear transport factor 2 family protein [Roseobacter sp. YSTF-M11]|uniref:Nuclear transport factor 2 family protein n=1 Tax=Roseobacter insulae TaxID=2859783 RepID=A0A9X1FWM0_9RHOB|nr:nuclear transport factor 2 family protein [Roseobacter insulae]MBW4709071.1 nuclear transport factor 2 family protein [Roseobacter insulae]
MKHATFALAILATSANAGQTGDPVTPDTVIDRLELIRIADAIDTAVDAKDWDAARAFFTKEITVDFTSLVGGAPATIPADGLITGWATNLAGEKESFHLRGNHQIAFETPDRAIMHSHGYAWNRMDSGALVDNGGNAMWEVWGTYMHGFERTENGWRVNAMTFSATAERGNTYVRDTPGG